jgi:hypothetical protein
MGPIRVRHETVLAFFNIGCSGHPFPTSWPTTQVSLVQPRDSQSDRETKFVSKFKWQCARPVAEPRQCGQWRISVGGGGGGPQSS